MLKAWHLPVAPFIKVQQDRLFITLWLSGESLPQRITLRAEEDNEELSLPESSLCRMGTPCHSRRAQNSSSQNFLGEDNGGGRGTASRPGRAMLTGAMSITEPAPGGWVFKTRRERRLAQAQ